MRASIYNAFKAHLGKPNQMSGIGQLFLVASSWLFILALILGILHLTL